VQTKTFKMKQEFIFMPGTTVFVPKAYENIIPNHTQYCLSRKKRLDDSGWDVTCYATISNLDSVFLTRKIGLILDFETKEQALAYALSVPQGFTAGAIGTQVKVYRVGQAPDRVCLAAALNRRETEYTPKRAGRHLQCLRKWAKATLALDAKSRDGRLVWE
jgi:hypothetical protein